MNHAVARPKPEPSWRVAFSVSYNLGPSTFFSARFVKTKCKYPYKCCSFCRTSYTSSWFPSERERKCGCCGCRMPVYIACQLPRDRSTQCLAVWLLATSWSTFKGTYAKSIGFTQDAFCMTFSFPSSFIHLYSFPTFQMKLPSLQWLGERLQGADMHGNGYSGDTAAFLRLKHENCNKHTFIYQHHFFGSVNQHISKQSISRCDLQTYKANWLYVSMNSN